MNYAAALLELIKNKSLFSKDGHVVISIGEIADVWNRKNIVREEIYFPRFENWRTKVKSLDKSFLQDIITLLQKLEEEKLFEFKYVMESKEKRNSIFDIHLLSSLEDQIILKFTGKQKELSLANPKTEIGVGKLTAHEDGSIRYGGEMLVLTNQLKDLCRLFIASPNKLITIDRIKDELIRADRRKLIKFSTIAKYVSKLRKILEGYYGSNVIFNQPEEGWYFRPPA